MATETQGGQQSFSVPFDNDAIDGDGGLQTSVEIAKAELADEAGLSLEGDAPGVPAEVQGILSKYDSDPVKLAQAFKAMQAEYTRLRQGQGQPQGDVQPPVQGDGAQPQGEQQSPQGEQPPQATITPEQVQALQGALFEAAGNEARFHAVGAWAKTNLPAERLAAYNAAIASGDVASATVHFKAMQYDFTRAQGYPGRLVGGRPPAADVTGFSSEGEMIAAMSDARYNPQSPQFDSSYHKQVHKKVAASAF